MSGYGVAFWSGIVALLFALATVLVVVVGVVVDAGWWRDAAVASLVVAWFGWVVALAAMAWSVGRDQR